MLISHTGQVWWKSAKGSSVKTFTIDHIPKRSGKGDELQNESLLMIQNYSE